MSIVGLLWLAFAREMHLPELLGPFTGSWAAHLAMNGVARDPRYETVGSAARRVAWHAILQRGVDDDSIHCAGTGLADCLLRRAGAVIGVAIVVAIFAFWLPRVESRFGIRGRWAFQAFLAAAGSCGGLAVFFAND